MEKEVEAEFAGFQERIENARLVLKLCKRLEAEIMKIADEHESLGDRGMASLAEKLKTADHDRFYKLSDEYTAVVVESLPAMMSLFETLEDVFRSAAEMRERKAAIEN